MPKPKPHFQQQFDDADPLFSVSFHPERKLYATGFATGRVTMQSYTNADAEIVQEWTTKRHKSSCRGLHFDQEGESLYSVGTDRVLKRADVETGKVVGKNTDALEADPTIMIVNESYVLVGDEDANLSVFDYRTMKRTHVFSDLHDDMLTSIVDMPFKNKYHFLTSGSSTVTHLDIRKKDKAVLSTSDDQEDELMSGCLASDKYSVFGMSEGLVTIWNNTNLQDQMNRMRLSKDSIDKVIAGEEDNEVWAGGADGMIRKLNVKASKVDPTVYTHSKSGDDEITMLDFDHEYRLVSGSMSRIKIWQRPEEMESDEEDEEEQPKKKKKKGKKQAGPKAKHGISQFADL